MKLKTRDLAVAGVIAAMYAVVTPMLAPISYGPVQFRVSEALTLLPVLTPAAVPGLFIGCLVANVFGSYGLPDIAFGALSTLVAAMLTRSLRKRVFLAPLPPVAVNALIIGALLSVVENTPYWINALTVGIGQIGACYALGLPLLWALKKLPPSLTDAWFR